MLLLVLLMLRAQRSSLWRCLFVIPVRGIRILLSSWGVTFSGMVVMVYVILFIRGLLVLLISVSSISFLEQEYNFPKGWFLVLRLCLFPFYKNVFYFSSSLSVLPLAFWSFRQSGGIILILLILSGALFLIRVFLLTFKGIIRSL